MAVVYFLAVLAEGTVKYSETGLVLTIFPRKKPVVLGSSVNVRSKRAEKLLTLGIMVFCNT